MQWTQTQFRDVTEICSYFLRFYSNSGDILYLNVHEYLLNDIMIREADGVKAVLQKVNDFWRILYI